jgi:hypothetical protein
MRRVSLRRVSVLAPMLPLLVVLGRAAPAAAEPRLHDGFYLRLGGGAGFAASKLFTTVDSNATGFESATELAAGYAVRPGLIVGGGLYPMIAIKPSYDGVSAGDQHVSGTGPFVDYYLHPSGGVHVQGGLLFAAGYLDGSPAHPARVGFGYGAMAGVGSDLFVSNEWSVGGLLRVTAYRLYGVDDSIRIAAFSLLATATFN